MNVDDGMYLDYKVPDGLFPQEPRFLETEWCFTDIHVFFVQLDVDDGTYLEYKMPDGLFPQEPWFVESPDATEEDDGVLLVQGVDGIKQKD